MINIERKEDCVGCNACVQRCPKQCISMIEDEQGFLYPHVDVSKCIECGLCEKVCPVINKLDSKTPDQVYAAWNPDDIVRVASSSGGVFYALAKKIIEAGGVVFGARFNDKWEVVHAYSETLDEIKVFQGSKYVQSRIGQCYLEAERFLKSGRKVLFSGTPCQIAGLKRFLIKDYGELLLSVDVVCHGVPSPLIWRKYLDYIPSPSGLSKNTESQSYSNHSNDIPVITGISFRDKRLGWEKYGIAVQGKEKEELFEPFTENLFMQGFLKDLYLRPSCYECPAKCGKSHSDITLADFWGIKKKYPQIYSPKGISLTLANSKKGDKLISLLPINSYPVSYVNALLGNPAMIQSARKPKVYDVFWNNFEKIGISAINQSVLTLRPSILKKIYLMLRHSLGNLKRKFLI